MVNSATVYFQGRQWIQLQRTLFVLLAVVRHLALNTEHAKKSYRYSAIKVWNEIPVAVRELPTISRFKKELKEYLKS